MIDLNYSSSVCETPLYCNNHASFSPVKVSSQVFFQTFGGQSFLERGRFQFIDNLSKTITSYAMNDCISVFGIEKNKGIISKIICYHISSMTDDDEMIKNFCELPIESNLSYEIVIIGGNSTSEQLLQNILKNLPQVFKHYEIIGQFINLIKGSDFDYVSANMNGKGQLIYCLHNVELIEND